MTDAEIVAAENRFGLAFPPDYRLFLATLHTPDPPMIGARFEGSDLIPDQARSFPDWTGDDRPIETLIAWPLEGLIWSIEQDERWHPNWGRRPRGRRQREALLRDISSAGPQLVPVSGHRYLVGPTNREGNPVLSIYGSDVIVYTRNLVFYLPLDLGIAPPNPDPHVETLRMEPIPFWQDIIDGLPWHFA